jgi:hypothetical protein
MPIPVKNNRYFQKFNLTDYNGQTAINLMKRVAFDDKAKNFVTNFYAYTLNRGDRIDTVAFDYYDDVDFDWLIFHINDIIDPHYDVALGDFEFENYIKKKYGNERNAKRKIVYYQNNWRSDDSIISSAAYQALSGDFNPSGDTTGDFPDDVANRKKYWTAMRNAIGVIGYKRKEDNTIYSTNRIESINFTTEISTPLQTGEIIVRDDSTRATVSWSNTTSCVYQNVLGDFTSASDYAVTSETTNQTVTFDASTHAVLRRVIPVSEEVYFKAVTAYDREVELNESKRDIYLADKLNKESINQQLNDLLR